MNLTSSVESTISQKLQSTKATEPMLQSSSNIQKIKALSGQEWGYLSRALLLLPLLRLSLKLWSFQSVLRFLERSAPLPKTETATPPTHSFGPLSQEQIVRLVRMVNVAANKGLLKANCLPRSLAIWWLLRRRGVESELRLGVKPLDDAIQAHAWVEHNGQVLNDSIEVRQQFATFERVTVYQGRSRI